MPEHNANASGGEHVDDRIELYVLGALERGDADAVADHAATCAVCARQLAAAEATIIALAESTIPMTPAPAELEVRLRRSVRETKPYVRRRNPLFAYAALAASLLLCVGGGLELREIVALRRAAAENDATLVALVHSHFVHQSFKKLVPTAPAAKVLLGRSPQWMYVIVDSPACGCRVFAQTQAGPRDLGEPVPRGRTSTLFVPEIAASAVDLRAGARTIASVRFAPAGL